MTNAQKFQETFGIYATEMWAMPEHDFLKWLNADTPQTESTGSPIGDYRDGVGAWQTDCPWK